MQLTTNLMPILASAGLVPAAHPLLALSRLNTSLLITNLQSTDTNVEEIVSPALRASAAEPLHKISTIEAQEALDEAIRSATRAFTGLSQILPEGHPARGVALAELGKLLCVDEPWPKYADLDGIRPLSLPSEISSTFPTTRFSAYPPSGPERLKLAYETLVRALGELKVGFGGGRNEGGEVGQNVRKLAVGVEKELNVWKEGIKNAIRDARLVKREKQIKGMVHLMK
jgi:SET and MYND domain-containing protein